MPRQKRADFFEEIERIEQVLNQLLEAEQDAFRRMMEAPTGPARGAALSSYRRAAGRKRKRWIGGRNSSRRTARDHRCCFRPNRARSE
jgi:hypothetical protein